MKLFMLLALLVAMAPARSLSLDIAVTPSVLDLTSSTAVVDGSRLTGASTGDEFTLRFDVENRDADSIQLLFSSIVYDPTALEFLGGSAGSILPDPPGGGFGSVLLAPLSAPVAKAGYPLGTLIGLSHVVSLITSPGTTATGPGLAFTTTFRILDGTRSSTIQHLLLDGDLFKIDDVVYCPSSTTGGVCDVSTDSLFDLGDFSVVIVPEPSSVLLIGIGMAALTSGRRSRQR